MGSTAFKIVGPVALGILAGVAGGAVLTLANGGPGENPDAGLSDAQRDQKYTAGSAAADAANAAYVRSFEESGRDPRSLESVEMMVYASLGAESFKEATERAQVIVVGTVLNESFSGGTLPANLAVVAVDEVLKGSAPKTVQVHQLGGPGIVHGHEYLGQTDGDPLLLKGDRVLLMLVTDDEAKLPGYRVLYGTGSYFLDGGNVRVAPANPEGERLALLSASEVIQEARTLLGR